MTPFDRNIGFVSPVEQSQLGKTTVAIAGAGGDGGKLALTLARLGVGILRLADPEPFEQENINRQAGCFADTIGQNKAEAVGELVRRINPAARIDIFPGGVTDSNVREFVAGADVVADETEYTLHRLGIQINRAARNVGVPVVMGLNVGFGFLVTGFQPDGMTFEEFLGLDPHGSLEVLATTDVPLNRWVPRLPNYIPDDVLAQVAVGDLSAPSVAPGVDLCAGMLATEILSLVFAWREPLAAPQVAWFDARELTFERFTVPR